MHENRKKRITNSAINIKKTEKYFVFISLLVNLSRVNFLNYKNLLKKYILI